MLLTGLLYRVTPKGSICSTQRSTTDSVCLLVVSAPFKLFGAAADEASLQQFLIE